MLLLPRLCSVEIQKKLFACNPKRTELLRCHHLHRVRRPRRPFLFHSHICYTRVRANTRIRFHSEHLQRFSTCWSHPLFRSFGRYRVFLQLAKRKNGLDPGLLLFRLRELLLRYECLLREMSLCHCSMKSKVRATNLRRQSPYQCGLKTPNAKLSRPTLVREYR